MAVFTLPSCYPDFPTRPRLQEIGSPGPGRSRNREPLPVAWKPINQVRVRQFQKQIETIKKLSYDLNRKPHRGKSDFADKVRAGYDSHRTEQVSVGAFPRVDLHKQVLGAIQVLKGLSVGLNENFKLVCGDLGEWRSGKDVCPLCRQPVPIGKEAECGANSGPEVHLESRKYTQMCRVCGDSVLCDREDRGYICLPCASGGQNRPQPGTVSLYLPFDIEEFETKDKYREKLKERAISLERIGRKDTKISSKRTISVPRFRKNPSFQAKIGGTPLSLVPGSQFIRLILTRNWSDFVQFPSISPKLSATPASLSPTCTPRKDQDLSFSEEKSVPVTVNSLLIATKQLHLTAERVLTLHLQSAGKHRDLQSSELQTYTREYVEILRDVWKLLLPISPEAVSAMEMCVKGMILLFDVCLEPFISPSSLPMASGNGRNQALEPFRSLSSHAFKSSPQLPQA